MQKKKLPIGLSDFKRLIEDNYYYADKTLFIKELLDSGSLITLLPRPRRFGKTLNLSMLRYFFEQAKQDTSHLFHDLAIWKAGKAYRQKQGQYPVIYLTFKDMKFNDWQKAQGKLQRDLGELYKDHNYLLTSPVLTEEEKREFEELMYARAPVEMYYDCLKKLIAYLHRASNRKVIVLIDEYDIPIQQGYIHGYYDQIIEFIKVALSGALKDNPFVELSVLTGILRVARESIFSDLNNLEVCSLLSHKHADKFGLLESEVEAMLRYYQIETERERIRHWYNGYICGEQVIYNPWSIINYVSKPQDGLKPYWVNTSANLLIKQLLSRSDEQVKRDLHSLLEGKSVHKQVNENIVFADIDKDADHLFSFLLFSGYLKPVQIRKEGRKLFCDLAIPNEEVAYLYDRIIESWFSETIRNDRMELLLRSLTNGDLETFSELFMDFVEESFSYFQLGEQDSERVYQAFTLGMVLFLNKQYSVLAEEPAGLGRSDILLVPRDKEKNGVIIEFKKVNRRKQESLEKAAAMALRQIEEKKYEKKLQALGVSRIIKLGIAFKGNTVLIRQAE